MARHVARQELRCAEQPRETRHQLGTIQEELVVEAATADSLDESIEVVERALGLARGVDLQGEALGL